MSLSLESSISLQQNPILLGTQAFASPPDMASSGVWENVILPKTPTFEGVCGILYFIIFLNLAKVSQTPSNVGVFGSITFSHTPEEAMSGGPVKACVPSKI